MKSRSSMQQQHVKIVAYHDVIAFLNSKHLSAMSGCAKLELETQCYRAMPCNRSWVRFTKEKK